MIKQRGFSTFGVISSLLLFAAVLTLCLRIEPPYIDNMALDQTIESLALSNNFNNMSTDEDRDALSRTFRVNNISVNPRYFDIEKTATSMEIMYVHEERVNIFRNLDAVITFTNSFSTANN